MSQYWTLDTAEKRRNFDEFVTGLLLAGQSVTVKFEEPQSHVTQKQFSAMHVWCDSVADTLNAAGLHMEMVLKEGVEINWNKDLVKEYLYKPLLQAMTGKESTKDQTTTNPDEVANTMARHLGTKFGVVLPLWPDRFNRGEQT